MRLLLLGRRGIPVDEWTRELALDDCELVGGTGLEDARSAFSSGPVDAVIMGAGIDLAARLAIVQYVFETSETTTVHMKDRSSGPEGMLPFVQTLLTSLGAH